MGFEAVAQGESGVCLDVRRHPWAGGRSAGNRAPLASPVADRTGGRPASTHDLHAGEVPTRAFGLTVIQSSPRGGRTVPLVSTATSNPCCLKAATSCIVELQQRLPARADDEGASLEGSTKPVARDRREPTPRPSGTSAPRPVGPDEIGVAELTDRACPILLPARTRGCTPRTGRRRQAGRRSPPLPGACRRWT